AGQLLDQASGRPVVGFTVHGFDLDGGTTPVDLGSDITDKRGMFELVYITPAKAAPGAAHRLQLHILDRQGKELQQVTAQAQEEQVLQVRITVPPAPITPSPKIADLATQLKLPAQLVTALSNNGIVTLADIAKQGGLRQLKDPAITAN